MSETAQLRIGTSVRCADGACGAVAMVLVDPVARTLTHLVVGSKDGQAPDRLVPVGLLDSWDKDVHLKCTLDEFQKLEIAEGEIELDHSGGLSWPVDSASSPQMSVQDGSDAVGQSLHIKEKHAAVPGSEESAPEPLVSEIDEILEDWSDRQREWAETQQKAESERERFLRDFAEISEKTIRPAMESIIRRLEEDGGGGTIWEGDSKRTERPRLILWMSLKGDIGGTPRQDCDPYLQLDANAASRRVDVWKGDMWQKQGTSRATSPWELGEISSEVIIERVVGILTRAADHNLPR